LGIDWPMQLVVDTQHQLSVEQVAAAPAERGMSLHAPLNAGYTEAIYWLRMDPPPLTPKRGDQLWLEITPTYLDNVVVYQPQASGWSQQTLGDAAPAPERMRIRPMTIPIQSGKPLILRIETRSAMQLYGTVWSSRGLLTHLASSEWAAGVHHGINLLIAIFLAGAALTLRMRNLTAMATLTLVVLVHGFNTRGYGPLWLPQSIAHWPDLWVSLGVFVLPAAFSWQGRELLTRRTRWRKMDRLLLWLTFAPLLAALSIPLGYFTHWAWFGVSLPWLTSTLCAYVAWCDLRREGTSTVRMLMLAPFVMHTLVGGHTAAVFTGLLPSSVEAGTFWQIEGLIFNVLIMSSVGLGLVSTFRRATEHQKQLVETLAHSEHVLEERVRQRTIELMSAQTALAAALQSERELRKGQRQFFNMVNHEFRTPLAIVDSAATEQQSFPSDDAATQVERAAQIRRACRRLTSLVDNCLMSDRLDSPGFQLKPALTVVHTLMEDAAQLVTWSPKHDLRLFTEAAPQEWLCDATLVRIALSSLVDNAVKYAHAGAIYVAARLDGQGMLEFSIADEGPGIPPGTTRDIFEQFERGERTDQTRGFGLGLWIARRIARLHDGDVRVQSSAQTGTCFTLTLSRVLPDEVPAQLDSTPMPTT
jgi:signal transduction histidine kinase